jgi:putative flippase GtrA
MSEAAAVVENGLRSRHAQRVLKTLFRCAGSSLGAVALEFALLTTLVSVFRVFYLVAALVSGAAGLLLAFLLNRRWVFTDGGDRALRQLGKHVVVVACGIAMGTALLWLGVTRFSLPYQLGWVVSGTIVFFAWTFPMQRFFAFRAAPSLTSS